MDVTITVALIGAIALILTGVISAKYAQKKTENKMLIDMQKTYQGMLLDYQNTTTRLIQERQQEIIRREEESSKRIESEKIIEEMQKKLQIVMVKLGIIEPQRCLMEGCERRVFP